MSGKNVLHADNQQASKKTISDEYLTGFVDGEGCFYVGFSKRNDLPLKWQVITEFHLSQNPRGKIILDEFKKRLDCGYLKPNHAKNPKDISWVLIIKDRKDLKEKLIPFFKKHPLHSQKQNDLLLFSNVLDLIYQGEHLRPEGLHKIVNMVFKLKRVTNKRYSKEKILSS